MSSDGITPHRRSRHGVLFTRGPERPRHRVAGSASETSSVHVVAIAGPVVVKLYQQLTDGA